MFGQVPETCWHRDEDRPPGVNLPGLVDPHPDQEDDHVVSERAQVCRETAVLNVRHDCYLLSGVIGWRPSGRSGILSLPRAEHQGPQEWAIRILGDRGVQPGEKSVCVG